jgi:hypothetical protein
VSEDIKWEINAAKGKQKRFGIRGDQLLAPGKGAPIYIDHERTYQFDTSLIKKFLLEVDKRTTRLICYFSGQREGKVTVASYTPSIHDYDPELSKQDILLPGELVRVRMFKNWVECRSMNDGELTSLKKKLKIMHERFCQKTQANANWKGGAFNLGEVEDFFEVMDDPNLDDNVRTYASQVEDDEETVNYKEFRGWLRTLAKGSLQFRYNIEIARTKEEEEEYDETRENDDTLPKSLEELLAQNPDLSRMFLGLDDEIPLLGDVDNVHAALTTLPDLFEDPSNWDLGQNIGKFADVLKPIELVTGMVDHHPLLDNLIESWSSRLSPETLEMTFKTKRIKKSKKELIKEFCCFLGFRVKDFKVIDDEPVEEQNPIPEMTMKRALGLE